MFTFLNWEHHSPPPQIKDGIVSCFGFRYASPLMWGDGDLIFYFILSKIVALIGKTPAFKLQGALYLIFSVILWNIEQLYEYFKAVSWKFCLYFPLKIICSVRITHCWLEFLRIYILFSDFHERIQEFLIGGRGSKLWFRKDLNFFVANFLSQRRPRLLNLWTPVAVGVENTALRAEANRS